MFLGEYDHSIDAKGRLIVPARFREDLGEKFVVSKGLDKCLYIYPLNEWEEFEKKLSSLPIGKNDTRQLTRFFLSSATYAEFDKQGRIVVQTKHREYAGLDKDVVLAGVGKKIEIWSKDRWDKINGFEEADVDDIAERLGDLGIDF